MLGRKSKSTLKMSLSTKYSFLNLYQAAIFFSMSYAIYVGPRADQPIAYFMSGVGFGIALTIVGVQFCLRRLRYDIRIELPGRTLAQVGSNDLLYADCLKGEM